MKRFLLDIKKYKSFLSALVQRDIKKKYYKSVLGVLWTVLNPLCMMLVITMVFSMLFKRAIPNYPLYYFCGTLLFTFNSSATRLSLHSIRKNTAIIRKIYVPKFMLCISDVCVAFTDLLFSLIPLVLVVFFSGVRPTLYWLLVPVVLVLQFVFTTGLALILGTYSVFFHDLDHLYGILVTVWMYFTPLFYPMSIVNPKYMFIWELNPMCSYISLFRQIVYEGAAPSGSTMLVAACFSALTIIMGCLVFREREDQFFLYL